MAKKTATTQKKTATATKTNTKVTNIKTTAKQRKAKAETPTQAPLIDPVIDPVQHAVILKDVPREQNEEVKLSTDEKNVAINAACDQLIADLEAIKVSELAKWTAVGGHCADFQLNWVVDNKDGASLSTRAPRKGKTGPESFHQYRQRLSTTSYLGRIDDKQFSACLNIFKKRDWIQAQSEDWITEIEGFSFSNIVKKVNEKLAQEKLQDATPDERQTLADKEAKKKADKAAKVTQAKADTEELAARRAGTFENAGPAMDFKNGAQLAEAVALLLKGKDAYFVAEYLDRHNELHGSNLKDVTPDVIDIKAIKS